MKLKHKITRLTKFEFWPFWFFYSPFLLQWLYYSIRSLNFVYFTRANYKTPFGAFFQYSKFEITKGISKEYLPNTNFYKSANNLKSDLTNSIFQKNFIYKPDFGERGKGVTFFKTKLALEKEINNLHYPCLIQEFIDFPIELGILFYKFPSGKKGITSVVGKKFLTVIGDGKSTLKELLLIEIRASTRIDFLSKKFKKEWNSVIPKDKELLIEEIGNHNRGTTFLNYNHIICDELVESIDNIIKNIDGFHYGRLDLKCESISKLLKGESIKIIEVNGVASEAAHIYDPKMSLLRAYKDVFRNNEIVFKISQELKSKGVKTPNKLLEFINAWFENINRK